MHWLILCHKRCGVKYLYYPNKIRYINQLCFLAIPLFYLNAIFFQSLSADYQTNGTAD